MKILISLIVASFTQFTESIHQFHDYIFKQGRHTETQNQATRNQQIPQQPNPLPL
jgi:hypothetical protein